MSDKISQSTNAPRWGLIDFFKWKFIPQNLGGGKSYIQKFKNAWVIHNRHHIQAHAALNSIPLELLAGVCWIEVGGDPHFIDRVAFEVRAFDWSGPSCIDKHLTTTKHPSRTSFGAVSIQLRTAANTLGLNPNELSTSQFRDLGLSLERDTYNIWLTARHLRELIKYDNLKSPLSMNDIRIVGARYNRGTGITLEQIRRNTSYGDFIVRFWTHFGNITRWGRP
jgi:hypothetical protein